VNKRHVPAILLGAAALLVAWQLFELGGVLGLAALAAATAALALFSG